MDPCTGVVATSADDDEVARVSPIRVSVGAFSSISASLSPPSIIAPG